MNRIRQLRESKGLTMRDVAKLLNMPYTTYVNYEKGVREPNSETLILLADFFGTSIDFMLGKPSLPAPSTPSAVVIPVLGDVAAGVPMLAVENIIGYEEVPAEMAKDCELFGLRIRGSSMEPRIREGDVVIVRKQDTADSGDTAVVLVNGDSATVKRIKKEPGGIALIPNNPAFEVKYYSAAEIANLPVTIVGKVIELRGKF